VRNALTLLEEAGAVYVGRHFIYTSGEHGPNYINMDPIFPDVFRMLQLGHELARPFFSDDITVVAAPATGGIVIAFAAALGLDPTGIKAHVVWADKQGDDFVFERAGFADRLRDQRVLVVEDLLNTGGSVVKTCRAAEKLGAHIAGVSVICNRGDSTAESLGVPRLEALSTVNFTKFPEDECPLCAAQEPIVLDVGHGQQFRDDHPDLNIGYVTMLG
jgi:orotate phosphoribosyltransferase